MQKIYCRIDKLVANTYIARDSKEQDISHWKDKKNKRDMLSLVLRSLILRGGSRKGSRERVAFLPTFCGTINVVTNTKLNIILLKLR